MNYSINLTTITNNIELIAAFLLAIVVLLTNWKKLTEIINKTTLEWSMKRALDKHDAFLSDIRFWTRQGLQKGMIDILQQYDFLSRMLVLRLAKNGSLWLSVEEDIILKSTKKLDIHRTPGAIYERFFEDVAQEQIIVIPDTATEKQHKAIAHLFASNGVISLIAFYIPKSKMMVIGCCDKVLVFGNEPKAIANKIARMHSTISLLYNYKIDFGKH